MELKNQVVVITGASSGIGRTTAQRLAREGARVVLAARSTDRLNILAADIKETHGEALVVPTDMRDEGAVRRMVERAFAWHGRLDVLINNAGQAASGTVADMRLPDFRQILELNVLGPVVAIQAAVPWMRQGGGGVIVNVSSMVTRMLIPGLSAYTATKAALNALSAAARVELAGDNIRVVTMFPRMTATDFGKNSLGDPELRRRQRAGTPAGVVVDPPEQVAERILLAVRTEPAEQTMES